MVSVVMFYAREGLRRDTYVPHGSERRFRPHSILSMEKVVNEGMVGRRESSGYEASVQENWMPDRDAHIFSSRYTPN